ncbi:MAG: hypothetical protein JWP16_1777 [Alphaproteobacteria bacterium]|nr:hypothetical protein [Alphaproteobacteria bacterium]
MRSLLRAALLLGAFIPLAAAADPAQLTVTGQGSAAARPDEARISGNADARGATVAEALATQKLVMAHVTAALAKLGVPEKDFAISGINVNPQYASGPVVAGQTRTVTGYNASTQLSVIAEHPDHLSDILQGLADAGLNQNARITFVVHDPSAALALARAAAVKDAFARAQVMAQQTGVILGPVVAVTDGPRPLATLNYVEQMMSVLNPLLGASQTVSATVTVSWAIKP